MHPLQCAEHVIVNILSFFRVTAENVSDALEVTFTVCHMVLIQACFYLSRDARKPVFGVSDQVRQKPGYTVTEKS